jgi:ribonuclease HII
VGSAGSQKAERGVDNLMKWRQQHIHREHRLEEFRDLTLIDRQFYEEGVTLLAGVDEAGRGPLAGPVTAAAVVFPPGCFVPGINDSKKLTPQRRERLYEEILVRTLAVGVGWADPAEIDELNILEASKLAMVRALSRLSVKPEMTLIDAVKLDTCAHEQRSLIKGDARSHAIAAASIVAKVERDRLMLRYEEEYPGYGFARHKGYPTRQHYEAIERLGLTSIHRRSFVSNDLFLTSVRRSTTFERLCEEIRAKRLVWTDAVARQWERLLPRVELAELSAFAHALRG